MAIKIIVLVALLIIIATVLVVFKIKNSQKKSSSLISGFINGVDVDELKFEDAIQFFKQDKVFQILKENKNYIAVIIKEVNNDKIKVVFTLFDTQSNKIIDNNEYMKVYNANKLDEEMLKQFNDKDMIVLA